MAKDKNKRKKGSVIVLVLVFSSVFLIALSGLFGYILKQYSNSKRLADKEQALHIAESGIEYYKWYLAHELEGKSEYEQEQYWINEESIGIAEPYIGIFYDHQASAIGSY